MADTPPAILIGEFRNARPFISKAGSDLCRYIGQGAVGWGGKIRSSPVVKVQEAFGLANEANNVNFLFHKNHDQTGSKPFFL